MTERAKKLLLLYYKQSRKIRRVSGLPPLTFKAKKAGTLNNYRIYGNTETKTRSYSGSAPLSFPIEDGSVSNYRIYGNTVNDESVGDLVESGEHAGEYKVAVKVEGKNLCNNIWEQKMINVNTGNESPSENTVCCDFIPVKPNVTYSCSRTIANNYNNLRCYGANKNYLGSGEVLANKANPLPQGASFGTFMITDARVSYIRFNDISNSLDTKYMLVEGIYTAETMPPYEPYHAPTTTPIYLPEQICKVGDEVDYIDFLAQKMYKAGAETVDVVVPVLPTLPGTNTLTVGTEVQPSSVAVEVNEILSCGDKITDNQSVNYGKYKIPLTLTADSAETTDIYLDTPLAKSGNNADYIDYATQKRHNSDGTESSITLPAISTLAGTNTLTVGTEVQPSSVEIKGRIKAAGGD